MICAPLIHTPRGWAQVPTPQAASGQQRECRKGRIKPDREHLLSSDGLAKELIVRLFRIAIL